MWPLSTGSTTDETCYAEMTFCKCQKMGEVGKKEEEEEGE